MLYRSVYGNITGRRKNQYILRFYRSASKIIIRLTISVNQKERKKERKKYNIIR